MIRYCTLLICVATYFIVTLENTTQGEHMNAFKKRSLVINALKGDKEVAGAIERTGASLPEFITAWISRSNITNQFLVTVVREHDETLQPVGILVEEIEGERIFGKYVTNTFPILASDEVSCSFDEVIDWRFRNALEITGGNVFREFLRRLSANDQRKVLENAPFYIRSEENNSYRIAVVERNINKLRNILVDTSGHVQEQFEAPCRSSEGDDWIEVIRVNIAEYMLMYGDAECVDLALEYERLYKGTLRWDPLHLAVSKGNSIAIDRLLELGVDVNVTDDELSYSALHLAVVYTDHDAVKNLLNMHADTEATTHSRETPVFYATSRDIIESLVRAGANINATDDLGRTPLDRHLMNSEFELASIVEQLGGKPSGLLLRAEPPAFSINQSLEQLERVVDKDFLETLELDACNVGAVLPCNSLTEGSEIR